MFDTSSPLDYALSRQDPTHGMQALMDTALDPAEMLMRKEEEADTVEAVDRAMVFRRLMVFIHMGTLDPVEWAQRAFAVAREVHPALVCRMQAERWEERCAAMSIQAAPGVRALEIKRAGAARGVFEAQGLLPGHAALVDVVPPGAPREWLAVLRAVLEELFAGGLNPEMVAKRSAAFAMVFSQRLLLGASLEDVGRIFDQCRAAVSWRVRQIWNAPVEAAGGVAHAPFQKSAGAVEQYREAQRGNRNRKISCEKQQTTNSKRKAKYHGKEKA